jgi:hypothetical protein
MEGNPLRGEKLKNIGKEQEEGRLTVTDVSIPPLRHALAACVVELKGNTSGNTNGRS